MHKIRGLNTIIIFFTFSMINIILKCHFVLIITFIVISKDFRYYCFTEMKTFGNESKLYCCLTFIFKLILLCFVIYVRTFIVDGINTNIMTFIYFLIIFIYFKLPLSFLCVSRGNNSLGVTTNSINVC